VVDKVYKCLNPVGNQEPVDLYPLAPRLKSIDGKTIHFCICDETDILIPLETQLKRDYPNVNWTVKIRYHIVPWELTEEEWDTTDAVILGVCR
jgi:hypothetical protein